MKRSAPSPHAHRIEVGAYYTDGYNLAEVTRVYPLGHVQLVDASSGEHFSFGLNSFREHWWLARSRHPPEEQ